DIEAELGRRRTVANAQRTIDLDVIAYHDQVIDAVNPVNVAIPHPRMHTRTFVLLPLQDIQPTWRHPGSGKTLDQLIDALPDDQICRPMADGPGLYGTEWAGQE
ncbi:MAG: 2-amino-4-hydroxy-6-hydroxymethyldihydropteridine diphosphokinase, partial [Rhodospirillales bacterium]